MAQVEKPLWTGSFMFRFTFWLAWVAFFAATWSYPGAALALQPRQSTKSESQENQPETKIADEVTEQSSDAKARVAATERLSLARQRAADAPRQPFFNHWLWLAAFALILFGIAYIPRGLTVASAANPNGSSIFDIVQRFAFRFTALYFCLFFFPAPLTYIPWLGMLIYPYLHAVDSTIVRWMGEYVLGVGSDWVPFSGSGDSTESYVRLLCVFSLALFLAIAWSLVDRRKINHWILKDLFHSNITYLLAITMIGYGLGKCGYSRNQFGITSGAMLETTWGDSSPMGALWKFMGASRPYTIFAGLGETIGALLLLFRRTRTLGALVVFGVMVNVVMLNFCYDVPVKINSSHLALLALCLAMRESGRLGNVLFFNRPTEPVDLEPPYSRGAKSKWLYRGIKLALVIMWFGIPLYSHVAAEIEYARRPVEPEFFQSFGVSEFRINDEVQSPEAAGTWKRVAFKRESVNVEMDPVPTNWLMIRTHGLSSKAQTFEIVGETRLVLGSYMGEDLPVPSELEVSKASDGNWILTGTLPDGDLRVVLRGYDDTQSTLMGRGFRWINEVPFNR